MTSLPMPPPPFSLRQLQYAMAVAETLSFSKAAERCRVAQPSLSAQIAELEEALGLQLFERSRTRVLVTAAGREVIERARVVLRDVEELLHAGRGALDPLAGMLRLGVIPTVSPYLLPPLATALRRAFPRLTVRWLEDKTEVLCARLHEGALDGALLALPAELGDVEHAVLGLDPFLLATPVDHPLGARKRPATPAELRDAEVLLLDEGHCFREQALSYCRRTRATELEFRATSLTTLAQMVASGSGVTLLPLLAVPTEARRSGLRVRPLAAPVPRRTIVMAWRRGSPLEPSMQRLATVGEEVFAKVVGAGRAA